MCMFVFMCIWLSCMKIHNEEKQRKQNFVNNNLIYYTFFRISDNFSIGFLCICVNDFHFYLVFCLFITSMGAKCIFNKLFKFDHFSLHFTYVILLSIQRLQIHTVWPVLFICDYWSSQHSAETRKLSRKYKIESVKFARKELYRASCVKCSLVPS